MEELETEDLIYEDEEELKAVLETIDELISEGKLGRGVDILDNYYRRFAANKRRVCPSPSAEG